VRVHPAPKHHPVPRVVIKQSPIRFAESARPFFVDDDRRTRGRPERLKREHDVDNLGARPATVNRLPHTAGSADGRYRSRWWLVGCDAKPANCRSSKQCTLRRSQIAATVREGSTEGLSRWKTGDAVPRRCHCVCCCPDSPPAGINRGAALDAPGGVIRRNAITCASVTGLALLIQHLSGDDGALVGARC